jgi:hypothetical protein
MGKLMDGYNSMDPELRYLIADGDHEILEIEDNTVIPDFEFPPADRELTEAESAAMDECIWLGDFFEKAYGIPAPNPVEVECLPLGINGKPLFNVSKVNEDELIANISKIVKLRLEGNAEIEKLLAEHPASDEPTSLAKRGPRNANFATRLAEIAEECDSPMAGFLRGYVEASQSAMRRAVRSLLTSEGG